MGFIQLPNVDEIMQEKDLNKRSEMIVNTMGLLLKALSEFNGYITTKNVSELHAKVIKAGTVTAEKMDVEELSAIAADLGTITAGLMRAVSIYGSYIATRENAYPRAELNQSTDLLAVYADANNHVKMQPNAGSNAPGIAFTESGAGKGKILVDAVNNLFGILSDVGAFITAASGNIRLNPIVGVVLVDSFAKIAAGSPTGYQTLDASFAANMSFDPATRNLKLFSKNGSTLATVNIP